MDQLMINKRKELTLELYQLLCENNNLHNVRIDRLVNTLKFCQDAIVSTYTPMTPIAPTALPNPNVLYEIPLESILLTMLETHTESNSTGLDENTYTTFKTGTLDEFDNINSDNCSICMSNFHNNRHKEDYKMIMELPCNHHFHQNCIETHFCANTKCPNCRRDLRDVNFII